MKTSNPLPPNAQAFLKLIEVNFRPKTVESYTSSLRRFHAFLDNKGIPIEKLRRKHIESWMRSFRDDNLGPVARTIHLLWARSYLRWLKEHDLLEEFPEKLIHYPDFPRIPQRLPRPLPPALDRELIRRFSETPSKFGRAFLLMRRTGIRIGELIALEKGCVRTDSLGNRFLKVPLGKLHNERLVPLDEVALSALTALENEKDTPSPFLLDSKKTTKITRQCLQDRFRALIQGLLPGETKPITSHRLRHTYATELLNAGMSLESVMHLLGHHHISSTLRYAAVTQTTILKEYLSAKITIDAALDIPQLQPPTQEQSQNDTTTLLDSVSLIRRKILQTTQDSARLRKLKRLSKIEKELQSLSEITGCFRA